MNLAEGLLGKPASSSRRARGGGVEPSSADASKRSRIATSDIAWFRCRRVGRWEVGVGSIRPEEMRMKRVVAVIAVGLFAAACASHTDPQRPATQDDFGVQMAKMNLWREAMFRFKRAVQINPNDALAHNNLAVAYEAVGDFENARKEYLEALKLDRGNAYIQKNYSRYVEFLSRNRKREQRDTKTAGTSMPKAGGSATTGTNPPLIPP